MGGKNLLTELELEADPLPPIDSATASKPKFPKPSGGRDHQRKSADSKRKPAGGSREQKRQRADGSSKKQQQQEAAASNGKRTRTRPRTDEHGGSHALEEKSSECRHEPGPEVAVPHCSFDSLPLVGSSDEEFLSTDWSLDAPEPPVIGCGYTRALFTAAGQYECQKWDHGVRLQLLRNLTQFLTDNDVPYILSYGTLLGSYRHGEIAWWDDDADIVVESKHRQKLLRLTKEAGRQWGFSFVKGFFGGKKGNVFTLPAEYLIFSNDNEEQKQVWSESQSLKESTGGFFLAATTHLRPSATTKKGCQAPKRNLYIDIFLMWPVDLPEHTGLYTFGRVELYSFADIFPVRDCWLGGYRFACPRRTRAVLTRQYHNIAPLGTFNRSACELQENRAALDKSKWALATPGNFPAAPSMVQADTGRISVYVPDAYAEELSEFTGSLPESGDNEQGKRYGAWVGDPGFGDRSRGRGKGKRIGSGKGRGKRPRDPRDREPNRPRGRDREPDRARDRDRGGPEWAHDRGDRGGDGDRGGEKKWPRDRDREPGRKRRRPQPGGKQRGKAGGAWKDLWRGKTPGKGGDGRRRR